VAIKMHCHLLPPARGAPKHPPSKIAVRSNTTRLIHDNRSYWMNSCKQASTTTASTPDRKTNSTAWRGWQAVINSHVSSTHVRAHALWCAVKYDLVTCHNITYVLTCDWIVFMSWPWPLTSWPSTLVVNWLSRKQTMLQSHTLVASTLKF